MASSITRLPEELHCCIAGFLDPKDICALRLTCKGLCAAVTQELFRLVRLYPSKESVTRYNAILNRADLSRHVRAVELNTLNKNEVEKKASGSAKLDDEYISSLAAFDHFPNLAAITLRFSENASSGYGPSGDPGYASWSEWPQDFDFRQTVLQPFFDTLARPSARDIKDVCIDNIQNINGDITTSETALKVLSRLTALRLYIATETNSADPESDLEMDELHDFMAGLPSVWLEPAAANLTTLVLYQSTYFGYCPKLDLRGLHLPNLRTLALGNYVFTHDWQLDWLSSHSYSLENLYLDDCLVVFYADIRCSIDSDGYPDILAPEPEHEQEDESEQRVTQTIDQTWARIFDHFRTHLTSLRHFRIGRSTRWSRGYPAGDYFQLAQYEDLAIDLNSDRYQLFDMGMCPSPFTNEVYFDEEDCEGDPDRLRALAFLEGLDQQFVDDREALVALLNAIGQPLPPRFRPEGEQVG